MIGLGLNGLFLPRSPRFIQQSQMLICGGGGSPALCLLLRMVTDLPMLITHQAPLSFRMPSQGPLPTCLRRF